MEQVIRAYIIRDIHFENRAKNPRGKLYQTVCKIVENKKPPLLRGGLKINLVDPIGLEPITSTTSMWRSSQMS